MDTATVSVLVSGALGLGGLTVPMLLARMGDERHRRDARDARFDELRTVIDAAALALMSVRQAEPQAEASRGAHDDVRDALPRLRASLFRSPSSRHALPPGLGLDSEIVRRYADAHDALEGLYVYWRAVADGETPEREFAAANAAIPVAVSAFFATAAATIGPEREAASSRPSRRTPDTDSLPAG